MISLVNGSAQPDASNATLLKAIKANYTGDVSPLVFELSPDLGALPLYSPLHDHRELVSDPVIRWRKHIQTSKAVIISTPVYLYNIPAQLKNALEWLTTNGELMAKPVVAITYTPHAPRGERAMQSLLSTLHALDARVLAQCSLYQNELQITEDLRMQGDDSLALIKGVLDMIQA